eukprot:4868849-Pyramimonas_sp.AAC.1
MHFAGRGTRSVKFGATGAAAVALTDENVKRRVSQAALARGHSVRVGESGGRGIGVTSTTAER